MSACLKCEIDKIRLECGCLSDVHKQEWFVVYNIHYKHRAFEKKKKNTCILKHLHVRRKLYKFPAPPKCCSFPADLRTEKTQAFFFATSSLQCAHLLVYRNNITHSIAKTSPDHVPAYSELWKEKPSKDGLVFLHLFGCKENRGRGSINSITNSQCRPNLVSETRKCPLIFNASTQSETSCVGAHKLEHPGMLPYYMGPIRKCPAHPPCGCETKNDYDKFLLETLLIPRSQTVLVEGPSNQTQWREKNCVKNRVL